MTDWPLATRRLVAGLALALIALPGLADDGPRVRSKAAAEAENPDRSGYDKSDERGLPEWEQAAFFNVRARGKFFVFVIDCSGSMGDGRLIRAKMELRRTIAKLQFPQRYLVIFYNDETLSMPGGVPRSADLAAKIDLERWMGRIDADGGTDPRGAMRTALGLKPDAVFLLSDGEFPRGTVQSIGSRNPNKIPVHCIDLGDGTGSDQLKAIAEQSGGKYAER